MKKLDLFKYVAVFAAFIALFFAGCGERDDELVDGTDQNNPNNPNGEITIPTEPPSVSDADKNRKPTKGENGNNSAVTTTTLPDFIETYLSAINIYYGDNYSIAKRADERPYEYEKEILSAKANYTIRDENGGRVEVASEMLIKYEWYEETEEEIDINYENFTYKFFDFSNSGELFLSGAVGILGEHSDNGEQNGKVNGIINFAGKYKGKVVFDNTTANFEHETITITSGKFYVQSDGKKEIDLPDEVFLGFLGVEQNNIDSDNIDSDNNPITISMPAAPNVTGGNLSNRGGETVNDINVNAFFSAFVQELNYSYSYTRAAVEARQTWEELKHGRTNGYYTEKGDGIVQANNTGDYSSNTTKLEYHDYSNKDILYFGGGLGSAKLSVWKENLPSEAIRIVKGTVKFNGNFRGELVFNDFKYKYEYESAINHNDVYTHISGSVNIGNLDVTQKYFEYVIKGNSIPLL
ncbi:MAG: hypothetical protein FWF51_08375 [Chitinivibrionia bacterium]|nr:hypothetical protein [Chitinivibrionia bacterium]